MSILSVLLPGPATAARLWLYGTLAWCALVAAFEAGAVARELESHHTAHAITEGRMPATALPLACDAVRGLRYVDYQVHALARDGPAYCWFTVADFRRLHPDYAGVSDRDLYFATWRKTGQPVTVAATRERLTSELAGALAEAATPPAIAGVGMLLFGWWLRGGRHRRRTRRASTRNANPA